VRTNGVSPKVLAATITGLVVYLITKLGVQADPVVEQAINVFATVFAAYLAPPGAVVAEPVGSDARLPAQADAVIAGQRKDSDA
jgi:hypothetical protein